jgi:hypothetical protein
MITIPGSAEEIDSQNKKAGKAKMPRWLLLAFLGSCALLAYRLCTIDHEAILSKLKVLKSNKGVVTGIFYSPERTAAVVGKQIVAEGDIVDGVTILHISRDSVEFKRNGKTWSQKVEQKANRAWSERDPSESGFKRISWLWSRDSDDSAQ